MKQVLAPILTDVSRRKKLEDQLRQSQKLAALGQLTTSIIHDFNNLLSIILVNSQLLNELVGDADNEVREVIANVVNTGNRGARLTQQLLAFSRTQKLEPAIVEPADVISSLMSLLKICIGNCARIEIHSVQDLWQSKLDVNLLESALLNLVINAKDAMSHNGVLRIDLRNESFQEEKTRLLGLDPGDYVVIEVSDNGSGIDSSIIDHVFEPFFTTKDPDKGTGLGLTLVSDFAQQSGGNVTIESESRIGTSVTLWLPRAMQ
ncbi:MAG: ATP-binding protein [bacterium]|nr:hypothetical protein [Gammaproteobacteria bacterium]HIL94882.1 hypothetical protein [Pseudomonadales bacterium]